MLQKERSKREHNYLKEEIQYTDYVSEKMNFKECTYDDYQTKVTLNNNQNENEYENEEDDEETFTQSFIVDLECSQ